MASAPSQPSPSPNPLLTPSTQGQHDTEHAAKSSNSGICPYCWFQLPCMTLNHYDNVVHCSFDHGTSRPGLQLSETSVTPVNYSTPPPVQIPEGTLIQDGSCINYAMAKGSECICCLNPRAIDACRFDGIREFRSDGVVQFISSKELDEEPQFPSSWSEPVQKHHIEALQASSSLKAA